MGQPAITLYGSQAEKGTPADLQEESIWDSGTLKLVNEFAKTVEDVGKAREALTAQIAAGKTALIDCGFNKDALEAAIKYSRTPEDKRENFDLTYLYVRKALGTPIQDDLFVAAVQEQVKVTRTIPGDDEDI